MRPTDHETIASLQRRLVGGYQLLQALVGIRLRVVHDPESRRHLTWLSDVTAALGLMSRRMADGGPIDFGGYLEDLANFWRRHGAASAIRFEVRAAEEDLPESHALSLAIIAHELLANVAKHAFPTGQSGAAAIAYTRSRDGVSLVVRDTGVGAESLSHGEGLALVQGLVDHLNGTMSIETAVGQGVGVRIWLPAGETPQKGFDA